MSKIAKIEAMQVLDSRGTPTVSVSVMTASGAWGRATVPSGASTGEHEAIERRDNNKNEYFGRAVRCAVDSVNTEIADALCGEYDAFDQRAVDLALRALDGTEDKSRLGANALLGVSLALCRAAAKDADVPLYRYIGGVGAHILPTPMMNILNGGRHADNGLDFQEFMIVPGGAGCFEDALRMGVETFWTLREILVEKGLSTGVGDEGGFAPEIDSNEQAIELILAAVKRAGYAPGKDVKIALDVAASEFYDSKKKAYLQGDDARDRDGMIEYIAKLCDDYPIISVEDGLHEDDFEGWASMNKRLGARVQLVGDDLFVTNSGRIITGIGMNSANAVLIKPNQIGTLTETLDAVRTAHAAGWHTVISHRSGESEDTTIADIAVATGSGQIKTGSLCRGERTAKYNRLLAISKNLGRTAEYRGFDAFASCRG